MEKNFVTLNTAVNATETNKSLLDTYTVPLSVSKLVEVGAMIQMAGVTTLEGVGGILEIESDDAPNWTTQQFVLDEIIPLTSGTVCCKPTIHDCNIPVTPGAHLKFSATFNVALTINPSVRCFGKFV
jgi:hypothetical protein